MGVESEGRGRMDDRCARMRDDEEPEVGGLKSEPGEIRCASSYRKFHGLRVGSQEGPEGRWVTDDRRAWMRGRHFYWLTFNGLFATEDKSI